MSSTNYSTTYAVHSSAMLDGLEDVRRNFRSFLFSDNVRRAGVINPSPLVEGMDLAEVWGADPIHPCKEIYTQAGQIDD